MTKEELEKLLNDNASHLNTSQSDDFAKILADIQATSPATINSSPVAPKPTALIPNIVEEEKIPEPSQNLITPSTTSPYKDALDYRKKMGLFAGLGQAASTIGAAFAGIKPAADFSGIERMGEKAIEDTKLLEDTDPNSQKSKNLRSTLSQMFPEYTKTPGFTTMSYQDWKDSGQDMIKLKETLDAKKEATQLAAQTQKDNLALRGQIAKTQADALAESQSRKQQEFEDKKQRDDDKKVISFEKDTRDLASLDESIAQAELGLGFKLRDINPNTGKLKTPQGKEKSVDIPGVNLPILGTRVSFYSDKAKQIEDSFQAVKNTILKARSGAAVTEPEFRRLRGEFSEGAFRTEEDKLKALARVSDAYRAVYNRAYRSLPENLRSRVEQEGIVPGDIIERQSTSSTLPGSDMVKIQLPDGRQGTIPKANLEAAKKQGAKVL